MKTPIWRVKPYAPGTKVGLEDTLKRVLQNARENGLVDEADLLEAALKDGLIEVASDSAIYCSCAYTCAYTRF